MSLDFFNSRSLVTKITTFTLLIFVVSVWALTFYAARTLRQDQQELLGKQQLALVTLVAGEVDTHLRERLQALEMTAQALGPHFRGHAGNLHQALEDRLGFLGLFNAGVVVLDQQGTVIAEVPRAARRVGVNYMDRQHVIDAIRAGKTTIGKPIQGRTIKAPLLPMATPIRDAQGAVIGALAGVVDLSRTNFLDDLFGAGFGSSGGFLLVAPQHGLVVTASIKSRVMAVLPAPGVNALVDLNRSGFEGTTIGIDPLNAEVLTSVKRVPVAGWFAVARMTTAEAFASVTALQKRLFLASWLATGLAGVLIWWLLRRQLTPLRVAAQGVAAVSGDDRRPRALPVVYYDEVGRLVQAINASLAALARRELLLAQIFDTASVAIFVIDKNKRVARANQRMAQMFGRPLIALEGCDYLDLVHPAERDVALQNTVALIASAKPFVDLERQYWRADQTPFWGHLTCRSAIDVDGVPSLVCVVADITERRLLREKNQRLTQLYAALSQSNDAIVHCDDETALFERVCQVLVQVGGLQTVFIGRADAQQQIRPLACAGAGSDFVRTFALDLALDDPDRRGLTASAWCSGEPVWCQDYQADSRNVGWYETATKLEWASASSLPIKQDGQVVAVMTLFAARANVFDDDMRRLLLELSTNLGFALDTFAQERHRSASEQNVQALMESITDAIVTADSQGRIIGWNHAAQAIFGYSAAEAIGRDLTLLMPERFRKDHLTGMKRVQDGQQPRTQGKLLELLGLRRDGSEFSLELSLAKWDGIDGWYVTGIIRDITERKVQEQQLELAARVFEQGREGITVADAAGNIVMVNQAFSEITGYSREDVLGQNPRLLHSGRQSAEFYRAMWQALTTTGHWAGEIWNRRKDGSIYPEWLSITALRDQHNQTTNYVANFSDLSAAKEAENRILWLSHYDPLTGLPNRTLLHDRAELMLNMVRRADEPLAMLLVAIDHFGAINDTLGHHAGDQVLIQAARRLSASVRQQDTVARLGGKEFVVVLPGTSNDGAAHLAQELLETLAQPCQLDVGEVSVTASIGIASFPANGADFDTLFKAVDVAMRRAQDEGRNTFQFFSNEIYAQMLAREEMTKALRQALANDQLHVVYQPQVDLKSGHVCGLEALLRWNHPQWGAVSPVQFIPIAEEAGLIVDIGTWVLRQACQDIGRWSDAGLSIDHVAVNVSPWQFRDNDLLPQVDDALRASGVAPVKIFLEVTESALMDDAPRTEATLKALKALGVRLSLDDFGTGYSALSYLKRFPFDQVKVDQSFVREICSNASDRMLVDVIISMAHGFGMKAIAEGVETEDQCVLLGHGACDEIQGYLFSRPVSAAEIAQLLAAGRQLPEHIRRA